MKTSYGDALLAKQQALSLMAQSVASVTPANVDVILAAILMFINYDLIESGQDKWRVHIEGARQLIERLDRPPYLQQPISKLRLAVLSDFLVFFVIGSTFSFSTSRVLIPESIDLDPILRYAETNNYLSLPGPLLRIMVESFKLEDTREDASDDIALDLQDEIGVLLKAALDFDPTVGEIYHDLLEDLLIENRFGLAVSSLPDQLIISTTECISLPRTVLPFAYT